MYIIVYIVVLLTTDNLSINMFMINQINQSIINLINKLSNKSIWNYRLDISLYIKKTITLAATIETLDILVGIAAKLGAYGISLMLFIIALLIGAAIKIKLADYLTVILILLLITGTVIGVASFLITRIKHWSTSVAFYVLTDVALFFITIFVSQITVGKSALRIFCTEYTAAALLLYNMFSTTYLITTGMVCNISQTCNASNASVSLSDNLPGYIVLI
ncbi:unnamed protein product [Schistosoma rodhaini]|uniref:Uncharacterized protein n=1 Tax=Schistosoma rodhaini TaxID=6188 RepID=A0AA85GJ77_9TREM|nr:unnamed protein product [Schistosoma rodhaini]